MLPDNDDPYEGFDPFAGRSYVYPNNMPIRGYQKQAVEMGLFKNAMIVLPTGFGKTFIAAVVMYNFYRWYPQGKVIFVAPTRPLVAQQIKECRKISGIPTSESVELTGSISSEKRRVQWKTKRVFFATPQAIQNDLENEIIPARLVKCIVIDEAHRAQGNYAYVEIVKILQERNRDGFRIMALSATPGTDIQRVQQVMMNLFISDVMFRTEQSIDLMSYRNEKSSKAWTVALQGKHKDIVDRFVKAVDPLFKELYKAGLTFSGDNVEKVARYTLIMAMKRIKSNEVACRGNTKGRLSFVCAAASSLSYCFELLTLYGLRVFYSHVTAELMETRNCLKTAISGKVEFEYIFNDIRRMFEDDVEPDINRVPKVDLTLGHPKLRVVKDLLDKHFTENEEKKETRAMVFTKYRESVIDIVQTLKAFEPVIKPGAFVGQGSDKKKGAGMKQKEQLQMIVDFKAGKYNVLVATSVAEEGLDIGEVDLIICYDTSTSAISNTQRRGRTGRKRAGDVQTILTQGYEEKKLQKAGSSRRQVEDQLYKRENYLTHRYHNAPRMVPPDVKPACLELMITPTIEKEEDEEGETTKPKRKRQKRGSPRVADGEKEEDDLKKEKAKEKEKEKEENEGKAARLVSDDSDIEWDSDIDLSCLPDLSASQRDLNSSQQDLSSSQPETASSGVSM